MVEMTPEQIEKLKAVGRMQKDKLLQQLQMLSKNLLALVQNITIISGQQNKLPDMVLKELQLHMLLI